MMKKTAFYLEAIEDDIQFHIPGDLEDQRMLTRAETFLAAVFILWTSEIEADQELIDRIIHMASKKEEVH